MDKNFVIPRLNSEEKYSSNENQITSPILINTSSTTANIKTLSRKLSNAEPVSSLGVSQPWNSNPNFSMVNPSTSYISNTPLQQSQYSTISNTSTLTHPFTNYYINPQSIF